MNRIYKIICLLFIGRIGRIENGERMEERMEGQPPILIFVIRSLTNLSASRICEKTPEGPDMDFP
ncbi:MAG: hypothetical protein ACE5GF_03390 [Thermodesulfobacteriota bacterium]